MLDVALYDCLGIQVFKIRTLSEVKKKHKRRLKRKREKLSSATSIGSATGIVSTWAEESVDEVDNRDFSEEGIVLSDEIELFSTIRSAHKNRGFCFSPVLGRDNNVLSYKAFLALNNNTIELYRIPAGVEDVVNAVSEKVSILDLHGHRYH